MRRFWAFTLMGISALTLWAALFGAVSGVLAYAVVSKISPNFHNSFASIVSTAVVTLTSSALPLGFLICGGAYLLTSTRRVELIPLLRVCAIRSIQGAVSLAALGALVAVLQGVTTMPGEADVMPPYVYGLFMGWFGGFFAGQIWAATEIVFRLRRGAPRLDLRPETPPIARP